MLPMVAHYMVTEGKPPQVPPGAVWFSVHEWDGDTFHRLTYGETERGKPIMAWPVQEATLATIVGRWGPGTYRLTYHGQDKRRKIRVAEPFTVQSPLNPLQHERSTDEAFEEEMTFSQSALPASAATAPTMLDHFMVMYPLLRTAIEAERAQIQEQYKLAVEQERTRSTQLMEQTRLYFEHLERVRTQQDPRVLELESQLRDLMGELEGAEEPMMDNPTVATIVQELVKGLLPVVGHVVNKLTDKGVTPPAGAPVRQMEGAE